MQGQQELQLKIAFEFILFCIKIPFSSLCSYDSLVSLLPPVEPSLPPMQEEVSPINIDGNAFWLLNNRVVYLSSLQKTPDIPPAEKSRGSLLSAKILSAK